MGGRFRSFDQTHMRMKFNWNFASSSDSVTELEWRPNKRSLPKIEGVLSHKSSENQKKVFTAIWYYIRPELWIYSCWQPLLRQIIQALTLSGKSTEISLEGTLKSQCGEAEISMGGR